MTIMIGISTVTLKCSRATVNTHKFPFDLYLRIRVTRHASPPSRCWQYTWLPHVLNAHATPVAPTKTAAMTKCTVSTESTVKHESSTRHTAPAIPNSRAMRKKGSNHPLRTGPTLSTNKIHVTTACYHQDGLRTSHQTVVCS
jgi:hypothetical protein